MVWLNLTMLFCILWSSNCCESNTQIGRNLVFLNSLFCTCIPILFLSISYPCIVGILQFKRALTELLLLQIVVKENLAWFVPLLLHRRPPQPTAPTTEGSSIAGIRHPDCLSLPQIFFPAAGSHENYTTIINRADDLEDYTGPQERSHSFVSAYVMHRLILHATLSSCSPIRLWVSSKLIVKLDFLNGCGVHIRAAINSIFLLSG